MAKAKDTDDAGATVKGARRLGVATVAKPCLFGAALLTIVHAALGR